MLERWDSTDLSCLSLRSPSLHFLCVAVVLFLFKAFNFFSTKTSPSILRSVQPQLWKKKSFRCCVFQDKTAFRWFQVYASLILCGLVSVFQFDLTKLSRKFMSCFRNLHKKLYRFKVCDGRAMKKTDTFNLKKKKKCPIWSVVLSNFCSRPRPSILLQ